MRFYDKGVQLIEFTVKIRPPITRQRPANAAAGLYDVEIQFDKEGFVFVELGCISKDDEYI